ncbi:MAG: DNA polymerase III subunit gamma/tau, partial [Candidatus Saccharibacteria bacterium]|nr:DNA polymerase III subunit gamma/tau [Candidatus Saccharibacteria bacterium]
MKALYRKYRSKTLDEVVGQEQVTEPLKNALAQNKISHAYLFIGPRGTGKTSVARIFAHAVNNFKYELEDDYVDIIEIDGASNRGIDNIRELKEKVIIRPTLGKYKVYIIDEVHMLTKEAFNALLKTLEEPPEHVIFIMATTDAHKVPITITSRAQTYTFKLADQKTMRDHLKSLAEKEGIKITDEALQIIAKRGGGSYRDSISLLDQISTLPDQEITADSVVTALGLPEDEKISDLISAYTSGNVVKITTIFKELMLSGVRAETLASELLSRIIEEPREELIPLLKQLPEIKAPFPEARLLAALMLRGSDKTCLDTKSSGYTQERLTKPRLRDLETKDRHSVGSDNKVENTIKTKTSPRENSSVESEKDSKNKTVSNLEDKDK